MVIGSDDISGEFLCRWFTVLGPVGRWALLEDEGDEAPPMAESEIPMQSCFLGFVALNCDDGWARSEGFVKFDILVKHSGERALRDVGYGGKSRCEDGAGEAFAKRI